MRARDVIYEATPIFFYALRQRELSMQKQPQMKQPLLTLVKDIVSEAAFAQITQDGFVDLTVTFIDPEAKKAEKEDGTEAKEGEDQEIILENIPLVRLLIKPAAPKEAE